MDTSITFEPHAIDMDVVFGFLHHDAYWSRGRPREVFDRAVGGSAVVVGALDSERRTVGFARVVSDGATFAWLCDVFVLESARGIGIGKQLIGAAIDHPRVAGVGRYLLATQDAHGLYAGFGFVPIDTPEHWMLRPGPAS